MMRFKSGLDQTHAVHEKRYIVPWRAIISRVIMLGVVILLLVIGVTLIRWRVLPLIAAAQVEREQTTMMATAERLIADGDMDGAETQYLAVLEKFPNNAAAQAGLEGVRKQREIFSLYDAAVAAQADGNNEQALRLYNELQMTSPGYRDVGSRILAIRHADDLEKLYGRVVTLQTLGLEQEAIDALKQIQATDVNFRRQEVAGTLASLNLKQGQRIVEQTPPEPAEVSLALSYFNAALEQKPNDAVALTEARLAVNFMAGREAYNQQIWLEAVNRLRTVYNERPNYLNGVVVSMLYQALVNYGNQFGSDDLLSAYELYSQACNLPAADTVTACAKASSLIPLMTPTPTPTVPPTPAPVAPTSTPTMTPTPRPLDMFKGRIIFKSDNEEAPGFYVIDPDGSNREYLGPESYYLDLFNALRETERYSPDKQYWVSTSKVDGRAQVILHLPIDPQWGELPPRPVTRLTGIAYDPVWAPDGSWIAFTTNENGSDDIWVIRPDSSGQKALNRNTWEWDKHASWSPDSQRLVFFTNRDGGPTQLYVMDVTGQNPKNISNVPWAEYDPIWVK
ncbi:MAG: PD40 domain-containing protein [Anaerolineales bacterium]|nr:PD40 domain-containing protein [Anaerolineales bacterium]